MSGDRTADVARLADMLAERRHSWDPDELRDIVADLQPVVDELARQRAAEELADAAIEWQHLTTGSGPVVKFLRARAAALRGTP